MICMPSAPKTTGWHRWADAVHQLYRQAAAFTHPAEKQRRAAQLALEKRLLALCRPFLDDPLAVQSKLCRRMEKHIKELFVFVAQPEVPPDNNAAERSLRHLVVSRKISGGTRSNQGTDTKHDTGVNLRYLAVTRSQPPHRLPTTARLPSSLNSYNDIPDFQGHSRALEKAAEYYKKDNGGKLPEPAQEAVNRIKAGLDAIIKGKGSVLSVTDNGIGLDAKRMQSLLGDGASTKQDALTGAYGVGHLAPLALSDIRYMLYGGLTKEGNRTVCGWTILASHPGKGQLNDAEGYLIAEFKTGLRGELYDFLPEGEHPRIVKKDLDEISKEWGHGSTIIIPAFNNFRSGGVPLWEIVSKVVAYNFCPAVYRGQLVVEVRDGDDIQELNPDSLIEVLEGEQDRVRVAKSNSFFRELRPSGTNAYSILRTLQTANTESIQVNDDTARISLLTPLTEGQSRVDLFRNGMWISDDIPGLRRTEFTGFQPFHATIEIDKEDGGELHRLILKAEGPLHDNFSYVRLSPEEADTLRAHIATIAERIKKQIPEIGTDEYTVDDYLVVRNDGNEKGGKERFSVWGIPTPMARRQSSQLVEGTVTVDVEPPDPPSPRPPDPPDPPNPPRPPRPPAERRARPLPFRSVVVPEGEKTMKASVECDGDFPEAWLTLRVDENTDITCDRIWKDEDISITSISISNTGEGSNPEYDVMSGGRTVRIKGLTGKETYDVLFAYEAPEQLTATVGAPTFRLELHRPTTPTSRRAKKPDGEGRSADGN